MNIKLWIEVYIFHYLIHYIDTRYLEKVYFLSGGKRDKNLNFNIINSKDYPMILMVYIIFESNELKFIDLPK